MRRYVRDRIAAALERVKPAIEQFIAERLQFPEPFPYQLAPAAAVIREVRTIKITPLERADLPAVRIDAELKVWIAHRAVELRGAWDPGALDCDVKLEAHGIVTPSGAYIIAPKAATLAAWWRDAEPVTASRWVPRP